MDFIYPNLGFMYKKKIYESEIIMSSQLKKNSIYIFPNKDNLEEEFINFNLIVIPFSKFESEYKEPSYIYDGIEKSSFRERHPVYKQLLLNEFGKKKRQSGSIIRKFIRKS